MRVCMLFTLVFLIVVPTTCEDISNTYKTDETILASTEASLTTASSQSLEHSVGSSQNVPEILQFIRELATNAPANVVQMLGHYGKHPEHFYAVPAVSYYVVILTSLMIGMKPEREFDFKTKSLGDNGWKIFMAIALVLLIGQISVTWTAVGMIRDATPKPRNDNPISLKSGANKDATLSELGFFEVMKPAAACTISSASCNALNRFACSHPMYGNGGSSLTNLCGWCLIGFASNDLPGPGNTVCEPLIAANSTECASLNRQPTDPRYRKSKMCGDCLAGHKPSRSSSSSTQQQQQQTSTTSNLRSKAKSAAATTAVGGMFQSHFEPDAPSLDMCVPELTCAGFALGGNDEVVCGDLHRYACKEMKGNRDNVCGPCVNGYVNPIAREWSDVSGLTACVVADFNYTSNTLYCTGGFVCFGLGHVTDSATCQGLQGNWKTCTNPPSPISTVPALNCFQMNRQDDKGLGLAVGCGDCLAGFSGTQGPTLATDCIRNLPASALLHHLQNSPPLSPFWSALSLVTAANPRLLPFSPETSRTIFDYEFAQVIYPLRTSAFRTWKTETLTTAGTDVSMVVKGKFSISPLVLSVSEVNQPEGSTVPTRIFGGVSVAIVVVNQGMFKAILKPALTISSAPVLEAKEYSWNQQSNVFEETIPMRRLNATWVIDHETGSFWVSNVVWKVPSMEALCNSHILEVMTSPIEGDTGNTRQYRVWGVQKDGSACYGKNPLKNVYA